MLRFAAGSAFVLLASAHVVSTAAALNDGSGPLAATIAPSHPAQIKSALMAEVGRAAARGEDPPAETLRGLEYLAKDQPLAPEPYLVHGAIALRHGDGERAHALLLHARRLAPRSPAARYLLADFYLRNGRTLPAMAEMSVFNRLLPRASVQLAPALAAFAGTPGAQSQLPAIVEAFPEVKPALLSELAKDSGNVELILAIAGDDSSGAEAAGWQKRLLEALVEDGEYARARRVWMRLSGLDSAPAGLFNPGFGASEAPPPFNWELASGSGGVAEPRSGALQVLYYGRQNLALATQLLLLPPGRYRLSMSLSGSVGEPGSIRWTVECLGGAGLLDLPLEAGSGERAIAGTFTVPAQGCGAQLLKLAGKGAEFPKEADFRIGRLSLARAGAR